jgi:hypothetical protein
MNCRQEELAQLKAERDSARRAAESSAYLYFTACHGHESAQAALPHEGFYCAMLTAGLFDEPVAAPDFSG